MSACNKDQTGEIGWEELLSIVRQQCGRTPAWDDPDLGFLSEAQRVQYFSNLVNLWLVKPAQALLSFNAQDPDFGFALLASVNAIPELLGKLRIQCKKSAGFYKEGLSWALGESIDSQDIDSIYKAIRCAVAHHAVIEGNTQGPVASLNNGYDLPVKVVRDKCDRETVCISPAKFAQALVDSLNKYIYSLRFELKTGRRKRVDKFNEYLNSVKG